MLLSSRAVQWYPSQPDPMNLKISSFTGLSLLPAGQHVADLRVDLRGGAHGDVVTAPHDTSRHVKAMTDAHVSSHSNIHSARLRLAHQDLQQCYAWHIACGRVGRGRQPLPDEWLQSQQPSQRGSKHHLSRRGRCSRPRHQLQSRCGAATCRRATGSRHRCWRNIGDNSCDVGSSDDDSRENCSR